jgi:hypothetical protein
MGGIKIAYTFWMRKVKGKVTVKVDVLMGKRE